jgi:PAS domain S-box-containing protein
MDLLESEPFKILVADDELGYIELYRQILLNEQDSDTFASEDETPSPSLFRLITCHQAEQALQIVKNSLETKKPISVAFLDVRMPPGPDGIWAAREIRAIDPHIEIVIVTSFSDYSPQEIALQIPPVHKLVYIQKPFRIQEIYHVAQTLAVKWQQERRLMNLNDLLERQVNTRTQDLLEKNKLLTLEIEARKQAETALKESEEKYRQLFENETDAVMIFDATSWQFEDANPAAQSLFGYTKDEFCKLTVLDISAEKDKTRETVQKFIRGDTDNYYIPERYFAKKNGAVFPGEVYSGTYTANDKKKIIGAVRNITTRKVAEKAVQESEKKLRHLSFSLLTAQENERKRIALELHDDFGQALTLLTLRLKSLQSKLPKAQHTINQECDGILQYVQGLIEKMRKLSYGLTPSSLEDLGLTNAIVALLDEFATHSQMKLTQRLANIDKLFSFMAEVTIYRIFQEALTNIKKHAEADRIDVAIQKNKDGIQFIIEDNGKGFDYKQFKTGEAVHQGLGLTSMDERVRMIGGRLSIKRRRQRGTVISVLIPFSETSQGG